MYKRIEGGRTVVTWPAVLMVLMVTCTAEPVPGRVPVPLEQQVVTAERSARGPGLGGVTIHGESNPGLGHGDQAWSPALAMSDPGPEDTRWPAEDEPDADPASLRSLDEVDAWIDEVLAPLEDPAHVVARWVGGEERYDAIEGMISRPLALDDGVAGELAWMGRACDGDALEQDVAGKVALIERGACDFPTKLRRAEEAGALAAVVFTDGRGKIVMGGLVSVSISAVMIDRSPGLALRALLEADTPVDVSLRPIVPPADPFEAVDLCMTSAMGTDTPGASIAIGRAGEMLYARGYGLKHAEEGGEVDNETLFRIASITKMFTAAAVMQQVEADAVALSAPITTYIPEFDIPEPWLDDAITVHHLLTHSHGLADSYVLDGDRTDEALSAWVDTLRSRTVFAEPGSFYNYANPGFNLAGLVAERASGVPFRRYVAERVWAPAGMTLTTLRPEEVLAHGNYSFGHSGSLRYAPDDYDHAAYAPAGGGFSTPTELVRWAQLLMAGGGDVLDEASAAVMQTSLIRSFSAAGWYGYGISVSDYRGMGVRSHGGALPGWRGTQLLWVPEHDLAVAVLHNSDTSMSSAAYCALRQLVDAPRTWPPPDYATDPTTWEPYVGSYAMVNSNGLSWTARVSREPTGGLHMAYPSFGTLWPDWSMAQAYTDTFNYAGASFSFVDDRAAPGQTRWLRHRGLVGHRVGQFPAQVALTDTRCATLEFQADVDLEIETARGHGWSRRRTVEGRASHGDDPSDPTSSGFRWDLDVDGPVARFSVKLGHDEGENLDFYVLRDSNGDGTFAYPGEVVGRSTATTATSYLLLATPAQGGAYQVWVHGVAARPDGGTFLLEVDVVGGDELRVVDAPTAVRAGERASMDVCRERDATADEVGDVLTGQVEIDYGYAPRRILVPVVWEVQPARPTKLYLPALHR